VLTNRLKEVIGKFIFETQSTFVKGWQILDGIFIANKAVDEENKIIKKALFYFKLDLKKVMV